VTNRRKQDQALHILDSSVGSTRPEDVANVAFGWLHEVLQSEFPAAPIFGGSDPAADAPLFPIAIPDRTAAGGRLSTSAPVTDTGRGRQVTGSAGISDAEWKRDWLRGWRRLQLPDQLAAYREELDRARTPAEVYDTLTEHAVRIVDGYTCVLFPPQENAARLRPVPNPRLRFDTGLLSLPSSPPLPRAGLIAADAALGSESPFANLAPLFSEERAASLAHAPFGNGGAVFLIERRHGRVFETEDWDLLRVLSLQAEAALERVHLFNRVERLASTDAITGLATRQQLDALLQHAWTAAGRGELLTIAALDLGTGRRPEVQEQPLPSDEVLQAVAEVLRRETRPHGIALRYDGARFLLLLPQTEKAGADELVGRVRLQLGAQVALRAGIAQYAPGLQSGDELVQKALHLLSDTSFSTCAS
jgi:GGDEF domain-containing protein